MCAWAIFLGGPCLTHIGSVRPVRPVNLSHEVLPKLVLAAHFQTEMKTFNRLTSRQAGTQTDRQTDTQTDRQTGRQTYRQTHRQDRQTY